MPEETVVKKNRRNRFLYIQAAIYGLGAYIAAFCMFKAFTYRPEVTGGLSFLLGIGRVLAFMILPVLAVMNIVAVLLNIKADRYCFLKAAMLAKYIMIPFFIIGGIFVLAADLLFFIPIPGVNFIGPFLGMCLSVAGYITFLLPIPFMIAFIVKSVKEKSYPVWTVIFLSAAQLFFFADVLSVMILSFKEKQWRKVTIGALVLTVVTVVYVILYPTLHNNL